MRYLSPSSLLGDLMPLPLDKKAIQLSRKKLFAEFELSGSDSLELQGTKFSRNDIINYFDDLQKDNAVEYHQAIAEDRHLLGFLEHSMIEVKGRFRQNALYEDPAFIQWISPYFYTAFLSFIDTTFHETRDSSLTTVLANRLLMTDSDMEKAWQEVSRIITDNIDLLDQYRKQDKKVQSVALNSITDLMDFQYIALLQKLPGNRFGELRDKYAYMMMQACIYLFNNGTDNRYLAKTWMDNAILLAVSVDVRGDITAKLAEMNRITFPEEKRAASSTPGMGRLLWFALVILIKLVTCNMHRSYYSYNGPVYSPPAFQQVSTPSAAAPVSDYDLLMQQARQHRSSQYSDSVVVTPRHHHHKPS